LLSCRLLLAVSTLERARRLAARLATVLPPYTTVEHPDEITWAVPATATTLPGTYTCLSRAVVTEALLSKHGYTARRDSVRFQDTECGLSERDTRQLQRGVSTNSRLAV